MSAPIVEHGRRIAASFPAANAISGDELALYRAAGIRPSGQLWPRIESAGDNLTALPLYSARIANAYRRAWQRAARRNGGAS